MPRLDAIINLSMRLIEIPSTAARPQELHRCAQTLCQWLESHHIAYQYLEQNNVPSILVTATPRGEIAQEPLLLMSHFDVVEGSPALFTPIRKEHTLHGRGSADDKYAVALSLIHYKEQLAKRQAQGKTQESMPFMLLFTGDEEIGGDNGAQYVRQFLQPEFALALDGGTPDKTITRQKGILRLRLRTQGIAAHGAQPWLGENAIENLFADYQQLKKLFPLDPLPTAEAEKTDPHWHRTINMGTIQAGTAVNLVPDVATAELDIRFTDKDDPHALLAQMQAVCTGQLTIARLVPPLQAKESPWLHRLLKHAGPQAHTAVAHGASDAQFLSEKGIPCAVWGADGEGSIHSEHEYLSLPSLALLDSRLHSFLESLE